MVLDYPGWRAKYVRPYKGYSLYVYYDAPHEAGPNIVSCSEAQGYALLISCLAGVQQDFDSFLRYVDMFVNAKGLMGWQQMDDHGEFRPSGDGGENCATDGDLDIAYALFLAARKWGNQAYRFRALGICKALWDHCVNKELYSLRLGDWVEPASNQDKLTRSSDFLLTHLNAFYHEDAERSAGWLHVLNTSIEILRGVAGQQPTGLVPDFIEHRHGRWRAATGQVLETPHDGDFYWNACRVPWRLGVYYFLTRDARVLPILQAQRAFFEAQNCVKAGYRLSGRAINDYPDLAFLGPVSYLFWLFNSPKFASLWGEIVALEGNTYFGDTIALLCTLQTQ